MKLTFLGTKGYIEESSSPHHYHSSLLLESQNFRLLIDHGLLSKKLKTINPDAILITHGHPDAFKWLKEDENYSGKIYVTRETKQLSRFSQNFSLLRLNQWTTIGPFKVLAYRVIHSVLAPAVGFKIKAGKTLIYNSDLVVPKNKVIFTHFGKEALRIGDKKLKEMLQEKFPQKGMKILLAYDGWSYNL